MRQWVAVGFLFAIVVLVATPARAQRLAFAPDNGGLRLPAGFRAVVVADDLGRLRFMAVSPSGDIYVKTREAGIRALRDTDGDGRADQTATIGSEGGTGIAVRDGWLYHSTNSAVLRYRLASGELVPRGDPEIIVSDLPDERQHNSKSFAFDGQGRLLVEVGSPSNALGDPDRAPGAKGKDPTEFLRTHGGFWRFDPDRLGQRQSDGFHFSTGHRHVLAVAWNRIAQSFFVVMHGRDQLNTVAPQHYSEDDNAELPAEELHQLVEGADLGWPQTYYDPMLKARMLGPEYGGDKRRRADAGRHRDPLVAFPAHWAPMQMTFYDAAQFPAKYHGGAFIAFHGSWNRAPKPQRGYNVTFVPFTENGLPRGDYEVFADGFAGAAEIASPGDARFRPCGMAVGPDGSLYVADSQRGRVWRIVHVGASSASQPASPAPRPTARGKGPGAQIYRRSCAVCHMADGSGAGEMQPALKGSAVVSGKPETLVRLLVYGADTALPKARRRYAMPMPPFAHLTNDEIAAVLTHVRQEFAVPSAPPVTAAQVAHERTQR